MRILVTGHAGFKGGWLVLLAEAAGHEVGGFGLSRTAGPSLYEAARIRDHLTFEAREDVTDALALRDALRVYQPDIVMHLAARAILKESFSAPLGTIRTNVLGTAAVLEAVRHSSGVQGAVIVTTDKVYRNDGRREHYSEGDELGGLGVYGASKAAAELLVDSYRHSHGLNLATARSGNVIGGGDWGPKRLIPTCLDAFSRGLRPTIFDATRPFLHVLDTLRGYLMLAEGICHNPNLASAYNFGPDEDTPLYRVADYLVARMGGEYRKAGPPPGETQWLALDSARARNTLGWHPLWDIEQTLDRTVDWFRTWKSGGDMELVSVEQVEEHRTESVREQECVA